jgi:hypothetical protein
MKIPKPINGSQASSVEAKRRWRPFLPKADLEDLPTAHFTEWLFTEDSSRLGSEPLWTAPDAAGSCQRNHHATSNILPSRACLRRGASNFMYYKLMQ